jgi:hypothetical protein
VVLTHFNVSCSCSFSFLLPLSFSLLRKPKQ